MFTSPHRRPESRGALANRSPSPARRRASAASCAGRPPVVSGRGITRTGSPRAGRSPSRCHRTRRAVQRSPGVVQFGPRTPGHRRDDQASRPFSVVSVVIWSSDQLPVNYRIVAKSLIRMAATDARATIRPQASTTRQLRAYSGRPAVPAVPCCLQRASPRGLVLESTYWNRL